MNKSKIEWCDYYKGWIEALIDGEGNLSLVKEKRPRFTAGVTYRPEMSIGNKSRPLIEQAIQVIGGGSLQSRRKDGLFYMHATASILRNFLPKIHLIVKEEQRQVLLDALAVLQLHVTKGRPRSAKEIEYLEHLWRKNRVLNGGML